MLISLVFVFQAVAEEPIGVVVNANTNSFHFIDPLTQELSPSQLKGYIGSYGGQLFDVVFADNGKKVFITNFGDSRVFIIDISGGFSGSPELIGYVDIPFFAEDMDVTPDGKYVLVTDGGFSSRCAVFSTETYELISNYNLGGNQAQAVAISPDGKVAVFADYWNQAIHSYLLGEDGSLTYAQTSYITGGRPVNVAISPDSKNVIAVDAVRYDCPVFKLNTANGGMALKSTVTFENKGGQSCVFGKDGTKAYYISSTWNKGPRINVIDITAPGVAAFNSYIQMSIPRGTSQLFGVDTIAIDPSGNYLYVANPTLSGGVVEVTVIDLTTNTEVNQLHCNGLPTGINFTTIQ
jgi:DNA-binding beta-propeller fold protein YncE